MLTVFQIYSTDNWNNVWFDSQRATSTWLGNVYMISCAIVGQFILLNLFVSILLVNFFDASEEQFEMEMLSEIAAVHLTKITTAIEPLGSFVTKGEEIMKRAASKIDFIVSPTSSDDGGGTS